MANLKQIKNKIKSVQNLKKITRALEVVSTVKLQKTKNKAESLKEYMLDLMYIINTTGEFQSIFNEGKTSSGKDLVIVFTSDRGLCGSLNSKILRQISNDYQEKKDQTDFFVIGKKGLEFSKRTGFNVVGSTSVDDNFSEEQMKPLFDYINESLDEGYYSNIYVYFNFFKSSLIQVPTYFKLFPLEKSSFDDFLEKLEINYSSAGNVGNKELQIEPDVRTMEKEIQRQIRNHIIYSALIQNKAGEFASRMIAMKNAKDNCESNIKTLTMNFNKVRQGAITQEISEIVGAKIAIEG